MIKEAKYRLLEELFESKKGELGRIISENGKDIRIKMEIHTLGNSGIFRLRKKDLLDFFEEVKWIRNKEEKS